MSIQNNDLIDLVQSTFSVDQYKSKIGDDKNVVVLVTIFSLSLSHIHIIYISFIIHERCFYIKIYAYL